MQKVLLTFLGTGKYEKCHYSQDNFISSEQKFFCAALAEHLNPDTLISLETSEASKMHGSDLAEVFEKLKIEQKTVSIPSGKTEDELWEIFTALTTHLPESCELHLDITHGFRSLPLLGFLALNFLRVTRNIKIGGIHYGAYDPMDFKNGERTFPIFDLTPFLTLLEWTSGAEQFYRTGSASLLGEKLCETQQQLWQENQLSKQDLPRTLKSLGSALQSSSDGIHLLRTGHLSDNAERLNKAMNLAKTETSSHAKPFMELIEPVTEQLTHYDSTDLSTLRELVAWLTEKEQFAAALSLASEWIVSYVMVSLGEDDHHSCKVTRELYARALAKLSEQKTDTSSTEIQRVIDYMNANFNEKILKTLLATASKIRSARNDINHAGFNDRNLKSDTLKSLTTEISQSLQVFSL